MVETVCIAIDCADGSVAVMQFVLNDGRTVIREGTDEEIAAEIERAIRDENGPVAIKGWRRIDPATLPQDRTYRNAWTTAGNAVAHDMDKARSLHLDRVRRWRGPKLDALDVDYMRALERGDQPAMSRIAADKQALRDLPATLGVERAATVAELKAMWPE